MSDTPDVPGATNVVDWFGYWPSFHDAEVTRVHLNRSGPSYIDVPVFRMTAELTPTGHYRCVKHAVVTFVLNGLTAMELSDFNSGNLIFGLQVVRTGESTKLILDGCYGLHGFLEAKTASVTMVPGVPHDSQHRILEA